MAVGQTNGVDAFGSSSPAASIVNTVTAVTAAKNNNQDPEEKLGGYAASIRGRHSLRKRQYQGSVSRSEFERKALTLCFAERLCL
ncbi:MAG: hypothetical protein JWN38_31 [Candidatus Saccharibacteria bacterium]|nr:hypothetical protein [Candidatus Saccharibacteria bacterium]